MVLVANFFNPNPPSVMSQINKMDKGKAINPLSKHYPPFHMSLAIPPALESNWLFLNP